MRRWFIRHLPGFLVKLFAGPYIAGDSLAAALHTAARLQAAWGGLSTLDILGEEVADEQAADHYAALYGETLRAIGTDERFATGQRPTLSFKPSALGRVLRREDGSLDPAGTDHDSRSRRIRELVRQAQIAGVEVTMDMEDRHWVEYTLELCDELWREGHDNLGTVLQTRLHRTEADLERIPAGRRIRLVIGIYQEPPETAITSRAEMKERLVTYGRRLLERGVIVEMATHDEPAVERFLQEVVRPGAISTAQVEFQFLLGVPRRALQQALREEGFPVRLYVPFAEHWSDAIAYARRRLLENPAIITFGIQNLLRIRKR